MLAHTFPRCTKSSVSLYLCRPRACCKHKLGALNTLCPFVTVLQHIRIIHAGLQKFLYRSVSTALFGSIGRHLSYTDWVCSVDCKADICYWFVCGRQVLEHPAADAPQLLCSLALDYQSLLECYLQTNMRNARNVSLYMFTNHGAPTGRHRQAHTSTACRCHTLALARDKLFPFAPDGERHLR
jgi:hypothetical protein